MTGLRLWPLGVFAVVMACSGHAKTTTATPETLQSVLSGATAGDTIRLASGTYAAVTVRGKDWTPAVTVEAGTARITSVDLRQVAGLTWRGGVFDGNDTEKAGVRAISSQRIGIEGTRMSRYLRGGIIFSEVSDARLVSNEISDSGSDGIDIALSRRILIDRTTCRGFKPTKGAHPDCIQLWSRPNVPPTADITITNTRSEGDNQGISLFNHVRNGVDDGGFDRITISNNVVRSMQYNGIAVGDCRGCVVRDNRVESMPNPNFPRARAWLKAWGKNDVEMCGNVIASFPDYPGQQRCKNRKN